MSEFENIFGAGADIVSIINGFSVDGGKPRPKNTEIYLSSFAEALAMAKQYPGNTLRKAEDGTRYIVEFDKRGFRIDFSLDEPPDQYEGMEISSFDVWGVLSMGDMRTRSAFAK